MTAADRSPGTNRVPIGCFSLSPFLRERGIGVRVTQLAPHRHQSTQPVRTPYNPPMTLTYEEEIQAWRESLDRSLRRPYGWLSLAGLYWLSPGDQSIGSSPKCAVRLPAPAPAEIGVVSVQSGVVELRTEPGQMIKVNGEMRDHARLMPDTSGEPTQVDIGPLRLILIERGDLLGLRLWDSSRIERIDFDGRQWFDVDPEARMTAHWEPAKAETPLRFPNELGQVNEEMIAGRLAFEWQGTPAKLAALSTEDGSLQVIFADRSSGDETYPGGRYLIIPPPSAGRAKLDFNRAYNPPCAFTRFATCTLPPAENRLSFPILAGERAPSRVVLVEAR
jgi:uncharacterized protein (DUF1684 family)